MTKISLSGQYGGDDAAEAVRPLGTRLKQSLKVLQQKDYSRDIDRFRIDLAVSGEVSTFEEPNGCSNFRIMKKKRSATARITMHPDVWTKGSQEVTQFLSRAILDAIKVLIAKVEKSDLHIDGIEFLDDLNKKALGSFLESGKS